MLSCVAKKLGGKAIWLSLLVALMFSLSFTPLVKAQVPSYTPCLTDPCPDNNTWWDAGAQVSHPLFPDCYFEVLWRMKFCPNTGAMYYEIISFTWLTNSVTTGCPALHAWLSSNPLHVNELYEYAVEKVVFDRFNNGLVGGNLDTSFCPEGQKSYTSHLAACNTFCYYEDMLNAKMTVVPKKCNSTKCCKVNINICFDKTLNRTLYTKTVTPLGIPGTCSVSTEDPCPAYISRPNLVGGGAHLVYLDHSDECVPSSCQATN
ncbi:MAG: hypothetical protein JST20_13460 [Bacteroidetes bacterium]|nr:hypothetical protein [Bacteroidota bacterium]